MSSDWTSWSSSLWICTRWVTFSISIPSPPDSSFEITSPCENQTNSIHKAEETTFQNSPSHKIGTQQAHSLSGQILHVRRHTGMRQCCCHLGKSLVLDSWVVDEALHICKYNWVFGHTICHLNCWATIMTFACTQLMWTFLCHLSLSGTWWVFLVASM